MSAPIPAVLQTPSERLSRSREQLRLALQGTEAAAGANTRQGRSMGTTWLDTLQAIPGAGLVVEALGSWWARHPLRVTALVAATAATAVVKPIAQRHPVGLVSGAFVLGGLFALSRAWRWRWVVQPALFAGLAQHLLSAASRPPRPAPDGSQSP